MLKFYLVTKFYVCGIHSDYTVLYYAVYILVYSFFDHCYIYLLRLENCLVECFSFFFFFVCIRILCKSLWIMQTILYKSLGFMQIKVFEL